MGRQFNEPPVAPPAPFRVRDHPNIAAFRLPSFPWLEMGECVEQLPECVAAPDRSLGGGGGHDPVAKGRLVSVGIFLTFVIF